MTLAAGSVNQATGFDEVRAYSSGSETVGGDTAALVGSDGNDQFSASDTYTYLRSYSSGYYLKAEGFDRVNADVAATLGSGIGTDRAYFHGRADYGYLTDSVLFHNEAKGFDRIDATSKNGGNDLLDVARPPQANPIEYLFRPFGDWDA